MTRPDDATEPLPTVERTAPCAADPDAVPALVRPLERLCGLVVPSLAPLVRWTASEAGAVLVHRVPAGAVSLESLRRTSPLRSGHVLTVARSVAAALLALHEAGLAHGSVAAAQVLVAPDGSVALGGTGLEWRAAPGALDGADPAQDVAALGDLVRHLLGRGTAPGALVLAALRASDPEPGLRPDAAGLLALLERCGRGEPLLDVLWHQQGAGGPTVPPAAATVARPGLPVGPPTPAAPRPVVAPPSGARPAARPPRADRPSSVAPVASRPSGSATSAAPRPSAPSPRHRRADPTTSSRRPAPTRRSRALLLVLATLVTGFLVLRAVTAVGAGAVGVSGPMSASGAPSTAPATSEPGTAAHGSVRPRTDWAAVLATLDEGRRLALATGSSDELARWVDPEGGAWPRDLALQRRLAASGSRLDGGAIELEVVRLERAEAQRVLLAVRDRRAAYDVLSDGVTAHVAARAAAWWTVTLTPVAALDGDGWRIAEVRGGADRASG